MLTIFFSRLKEIPSLYEEFRREIGTHFLDRFQMDNNPPERDIPRPLLTGLPQHLFQTDGAGGAGRLNVLSEQFSQAHAASAVNDSSQQSSHTGAICDLAQHFSQTHGTGL